MRRLLLVLLGLILIGGSIATFTYRWVAPSNTSTQMMRPSASAPQTRSAAPTTPSRPGDPRQQTSAYGMFETALNVANLVVGVVGIWLTLSGVRARRR